MKKNEIKNIIENDVLKNKITLVKEPKLGPYRPDFLLVKPGGEVTIIEIKEGSFSKEKKAAALRRLIFYKENIGADNVYMVFTKLEENIEEKGFLNEKNFEEIITNTFKEKTKNEINSITIQELASKIAEEFKPRKIVLFGSYAWGKPDLGSDIDLLAILPYRGKSSEKVFEILKKINSRLPVDLIVRTPGQVKERIRNQDLFITQIIDKGKVLYEAADKRVGGKGRRGLQKRIA